MDPYDFPGDAGRARGRFAASTLTLQEDGTLRCPAGASLWLQEQRQETPYAQRLVFCAPLEACQTCLLREPCLGRGARGNRARRVSAVRRLLPLPRSPGQRGGTLLAIRWVDMEGANHPSRLDEATSAVNRWRWSPSLRSWRTCPLLLDLHEPSAVISA
jgi:hypothetical protein